MKTVPELIVGAMLVVFAAVPVVADDLTGAKRFLYAAGEVTVCTMEGECASGPPWEFNVPDFIEGDLEAGLLKTTEASQENRQTPILNTTREDGSIVLQGFEMGRAFNLR